MHIEDRPFVDVEPTSDDLNPDRMPTTWFDDEEPENRGNGADRVQHQATTPSVHDLLVSQHYAFDESGEQPETAARRVLHERLSRDLRAERDHLRDLLPKLQTDLLGDDTGELSHADQHPADAATETYEREKDVSVLAELTARLHDIEAELDGRDRGSGRS